MSKMDSIIEIVNTMRSSTIKNYLLDILAQEKNSPIPNI